MANFRKKDKPVLPAGEGLERAARQKGLAMGKRRNMTGRSSGKKKLNAEKVGEGGCQALRCAAKLKRSKLIGVEKSKSWITAGERAAKRKRE